MKHFAFVATVALALLALPCNAVTIPYQNVGTTVPAYTVTAVNTGYIDAWFYGFSASDVDSIQVIDLTTNTASGWFFQNDSTTAGQYQADVLAVNAGDSLEFQLQNITAADVVSSVAADSPDGINHFYATPWTGGLIPTTAVNVPTAISGTPVTFLGAEDLTLGQSSDRDYNDDQFLFDNVQFDAPTPEPSSLYLLGSGLLGLAGLVRRKLRA